MRDGYHGKIFESIYESTLADNWKALVTFQQLIVLADSDGNVYHTVNSLSRTTNIPPEIISDGIISLLKPDPQSQSPRQQGRRIIELPKEDDGRKPHGWHLVNYEDWCRRSKDVYTRMQARKRKRKERAKKSHAKT